MLEVCDLRHERDQLGVSSKATKQKSSAIKRKMAKTREALNELAMWQVMGTDALAEDVKVTQAQLDAMLRGEPAPWDAEGDSVGAAPKLHFGRRYHLLMSDVERCTEQLDILKVELGRLQAWLAYMINVCTQACGSDSTDVESVPPADARTAWAVYGGDDASHGQLYFIRQHLQWCHATLGKASTLQW